MKTNTCSKSRKTIWTRRPAEMFFFSYSGRRTRIQYQCLIPVYSRDGRYMCFTNICVIPSIFHDPIYVFYRRVDIWSSFQRWFDSSRVPQIPCFRLLSKLGSIMIQSIQVYIDKDWIILSMYIYILDKNTIIYIYTVLHDIVWDKRTQTHTQ